MEKTLNNYEGNPLEEGLHQVYYPKMGAGEIFYVEENDDCFTGSSFRGHITNIPNGTPSEWFKPISALEYLNWIKENCGKELLEEAARSCPPSH